MADMLTKVDSSIINKSIESINKNTAVLSENLKSIKDQAAYIMDVYKTNGKSTEAIEKIVAEIDEINNNYLSNNQEFNNVMNSAVSAYSAADAQIQGQAMGLAGNDFSSGSGVVIPDAPAQNQAAALSGNDFSSGSGIVTPDGKLIEKPNSIPEAATLTADGRWSTVNADGKGTIYNSKGINGVPFETDDVRIKALASGMDGGQVVKMEDGRIAVKDRYGGGTIFNADGSTEAVAGRTIMAGSVGQISSSGDGADPFTQDLASEMVNAGLDNRKINRLVKGYESQQEAEGMDPLLGVDTEALRDQLNTLKEGEYDIGASNYGPGFSAEHNAQVLADQAAKEATYSGLNSVDNLGSVVEAGISDVSASTVAAPLVGNNAVTETVTPTPQNINLNDYGPGFSDEHNVAVLSAREAQSAATPTTVPNDVPVAPEVPSIPEPSQPIGFDAPGAQ